MFVCSFKASKLKVLGISILCAAVLGAALTFMIRGAEKQDDLSQVAVLGRDIRFDGIKTEQDLEKFIASLGIEVKTPPYNSKEVDFPRVFDAVYSKYNDIQKQQGFDLSKYCGKTLRRYTYEMTNYPNSSENSKDKVYLTLFIHKNKVVGGDISSRANGGFVTTFVDFAR